MHKFTIFTILLSIIVILVVAELVMNDYLGDDFAEEQVVEDVVEDVVVEDVEEDVVAPIDTELRGDEDEVGEIVGTLTQELLATLDLAEPVVTTALYDDLIYGFWDASEDFSEMTVLQHKLFDGASYIGVVYEVQPKSAIELFTAYETLRQLAESSENGSINENDYYGDASFYFNHNTKTNTVFLVLRQNDIVYALEYSSDYHVTMRSLIELL